MKIAYLTNQYPKVSHSFIRREILALEALGISVARFSIRSCESELVDHLDLQEFGKTLILLKQGFLKLLLDTLICGFSRPAKFLQALILLFQSSYRSEAGVFKHMAYFVEACSLLRHLERLNVQHLHAHFGTNPATIAMLCHALGGPEFSFTVHGPEEFDKPIAISLAEKIHRAKFVFAISLFTQSQLYRWTNLEHWHKIKVVRCGLDAYFSQAPVTPVPETQQLVCVGRLCEQKGQILLLDAARNLVASGYTFKLLLVGDGEMRQLLETLITEYGLQESVEITGWATSEAVRQHMSNSRAMVLPSFAEGLPVVIMEALALGRPVISTYVAGIPELVEPQQSGWLVSPGSVEQLVDALRSVLQASAEELTHLGKNGVAKVKQQHDAQTIAKQIAGYFRE